MEDSATAATLDFLSSRSLIGFQMDASHLHAVLQQVIKLQARQGAELGSRVGRVEAAVAEISTRLSAIESAIANFGGADEVRALTSRFHELTRTVEGMANVIPQLRRETEELGRGATATDRSVQQLLQQFVPQVERALQEDRARAERGLQQLADTQRAAEESLTPHIERHQKLLEEVVGKVEHVEGALIGKLAGSLDELNKRTNENFRNVERSAQQFDSELNKLRADLANARAEINTVDNDGQFRTKKITEDTDAKFQLLLDTMKGFEKNTHLVERQLAEAGRVLQVNNSASATPLTGGGRTSLSASPFYTETTTTVGRQPSHGRNFGLL